MKSQPLEISLSDVVRFLRKYLLFFLIIGFVACSGGYLLSFLYQNEYKATARLLPEQASSPDGNLNQLATLAGISMRSRTEALRPDLYPDVLSSSQFVIKLLSTPLRDNGGQVTTLFQYFGSEDKGITVEPFTKGQIDGTDSVLVLTRQQQALIGAIKQRASFSYGKMDGVLSITMELPDPVLAAGAVRYSMDYLIDFVTSYRTDKATLRVTLLEAQVEKAKNNYQKSLLSLNQYRDSHRNPFTQLSRTEEQKLEGDLYRYQNSYNELVQRLEMANLQKEEISPVIKILDPPIVPYATSKPRRLIMAASYGLFIGFLSFIYILFFREKVHKQL